MKVTTKRETMERTVYVANDGTEFDDRFDCEDYERSAEIGDGSSLITHTIDLYGVDATLYVAHLESECDFRLLCDHFYRFARDVELETPEHYPCDPVYVYDIDEMVCDLRLNKDEWSCDKSRLRLELASMLDALKGGEENAV